MLPGCFNKNTQIPQSLAAPEYLWSRRRCRSFKNHKAMWITRASKRRSLAKGMTWPRMPRPKSRRFEKCLGGFWRFFCETCLESLDDPIFSHDFAWSSGVVVDLGEPYTQVFDLFWGPLLWRTRLLNGNPRCGGTGTSIHVCRCCKGNELYLGKIASISNLVGIDEATEQSCCPAC